jgi:hypothetical protein
MAMDDRFLELYDRYCDGALTPAGQEELLSLLGDPAWRARFADLAVLEAAVTEELRLRRLGAGADEAAPACPVEPARPVLRRRFPAVGASVRRPWLWLGLAAAGLLAVMMPALLRPGRPARLPDARETVATAPEPFAAEPEGDAAARPEAPVFPTTRTPPHAPARHDTRPEAGPAPAIAPPPSAVEPAAVESPPPQPWHRVRGRKPPAAAAKPPDAPPSPAPVPRPSEVAVATVTEARGKVQVVGARGGPRQPAREDQPLLEGQGLHVNGSNGSAVLEFPDGTVLELGPETLLTRVSGGEGAPAQEGHSGKSAVLERGALGVESVPQPAGRPLLLATAHAEVRVIGTRLTLAIDRGATRLGVHEGEVHVTRLSDDATLKVGSGHMAVVTDGGPMQAVPLRTRAGLVAFYPFDEGQGAMVHDVSGVGTPLPLRIASPEAVAWVPGGLVVHGPAGIVTFGPAEKVIAACRASGEVTVEAWVRPAATDREGYLLAIASNPLNVNIALDRGGTPPAWGAHITAERTGEAGASLSARRGPSAGALRHVVYALAATGQGVLYFDGAPAATHRVVPEFARWDANHRLAFASDPRGNRPWAGELRLVAVYGRALAASEVRQHYLAGPD